jgi:hypothetical protein
LPTSTSWANLLKLSLKQFLNWGAKLRRIILFSIFCGKLNPQTSLIDEILLFSPVFIVPKPISHA